MLRIRHVATGKRRGPGCQFGLKGTSLGVKGNPFLSTKLNKKPYIFIQWISEHLKFVKLKDHLIMQPINL